MKMRGTLTIPITERNQFDGIDPPLRPGGVAHVVRCERDEKLHAFVGMLFARAIMHQGRIMFALHGGTIIAPDNAVVGGILTSSDRQSFLKR
jgi:hypothetical protein